MLGALIKDFYAKRQGISPDDIYSVSIMPCVAKKFEAERPEMARNGNPDIDAVLVTRELVHLIRSHGLDLEDLPSEPADDPFGERATAGKIFGASGGVMEAAIRTAYFQLTDHELEHLEVEAVRGMEAIKEARLEINGMQVGVAVANGLGAARTLVEQIRDGRDDLHFIEVMSCPGGCIAGGGQPIGTSAQAIRNRAQALYHLDEGGPIRQSHRNPSVQRIYDEYLKVPLGEKSHQLLHTHYHERRVLV
jgi:iron only hydrogenase large subunit-like protein